MRKLNSLLLLFLFLPFANAQIVDTTTFPDENMRLRAAALAKSLRCPQCQNQNLVESNSPLAYDLRQEVYEKVKNGQTNEEIIQQMTARFGNFVLYDPPKNPKTALLWVLPFFLALLAIFLIFQTYRKKPLPESQNENNKNFPKTVAYPFSFPLYVSLLTLLCFFSFIIYFSSAHYEIFANRKEMPYLTEKSQQKYLTLLQEEIRQSPLDKQKWLALAQAYLQQNETENALYIYAYLAHLDGETPELQGLMAYALFQKEQKITPKIEQLIHQALEENPNEINSLTLLATLALQKQDYQQAIHLFHQMLDSQTTDLNRRLIIERLKTAEFLQKQPFSQ